MSIPNMHTFKISRSFRVRLQHSNPYSTQCSPADLLFTGTFKRHSIDRPVPVESLVKCRMQDNLEFLQWAKKFWDQHYPGGDYDAVARRKASGGPAPSAAPITAARTSSAGARRGTTPTGAGVRPRVAGAAAGPGVAALNQEIAAQKEAIAGLEKERDFYFAKLRDIELLLQTAVEADPELEKDEDSLVKHIQGILYSTEVCHCCPVLVFDEEGVANSAYRKDSRFPQKPKKDRRSWRRSDRIIIRTAIVVRTSVLAFLPLSFDYTV